MRRGKAEFAIGEGKKPVTELGAERHVIHLAVIDFFVGDLALNRPPRSVSGIGDAQPDQRGGILLGGRIPVH